MKTILVKKLKSTESKGDRFKAFIASGLQTITEQSDYENDNVQPMKMAAKLINLMSWQSLGDWHGGNLPDGSWVFVLVPRSPTAVLIDADFQFSVKM